MYAHTGDLKFYLICQLTRNHPVPPPRTVDSTQDTVHSGLLKDVFEAHPPSLEGILCFFTGSLGLVQLDIGDTENLNIMSQDPVRLITQGSSCLCSFPGAGITCVP